MDIDVIRERALRAISPLKAADSDTPAEKHFLFDAKRTDAGRSLPPYYLVYFLLVDLLGFKNIGRFEKVAWSVPVEYDGKAFLIEHRKFGLGIFAANLPEDEGPAAEIATLIYKAVKAARPYFDWRAKEAAKESKLNVTNRSVELFARFEFLLGLYEAKRKESEERANEKIKTTISETAWSVHYPAQELRREAKWFALSAIECFFSWTEHVFIHIAILTGQCSTGEDVAKLAGADWSDKFKAALDLTDPATKTFYDDLVIVRRKFRNFVAHGAFGKEGEAFHFHSNIGTVPILLPHKQDRSSFRFGQGVDVVSEETIVLVRSFVDHLWSGSRAPAKIYIQDRELPLILTNVADGTYARAMTSVDEMVAYADHLSGLIDKYANMDF